VVTVWRSQRRSPIEAVRAVLDGLGVPALRTRGAHRDHRRGTLRVPDPVRRRLSIPSTIAAVLLHLRDTTGAAPNTYLE
jgi:hypothetical protein